MGLKPISEERLAEVQEELKAQIPDTPKPINVKAAAGLGSAVVLTLRGHEYIVSPLSFPDGVDFLDARQVVEAAAEHADDSEVGREAYLEAMRRMAIIQWKHMRPVEWYRRILKSLGILRNQMFKATEGEVASLMGFFYAYRMRVAIQYEERQAKRSISTRDQQT